MGNRLADLPLSSIRAGDIALRGVDQESQQFQELADSIAADGLINPIAVREKQDPETKETYYELIDGLQRFTASKVAGLETIASNILDKDDDEVMVAQIIGNAKRVDTKPIDFATQIQKIMVAKPTLTMGDIGSLLHASPQWLEQILKLKTLHPEIKPLVNDGHIVLANAFALAKLPPEEQLSFLNDAQTMKAAEFTGPVLERSKALRAAARAGRAAGEVEFVPMPKFRKLPEIQDELEKQVLSSKIVGEYAANNPDSGIRDTKSAAVGFALGLRWATQVDEASLAKKKAEFDARKKAEDEDKVRRNAERAAKKQAEAEERAKKAKDEAAKAADAAAKLPAGANA